MPQFEYSYLAQPFKDNSGKLIEEFRPFVPVIITKGKRSSLPMYALVDSGADFNLFPAQLLEVLNLDLKSGVRRKVFGIGEQKVISYETRIDFSKSQKIPLLGRTGFFDHFERLIFWAFIV